MNQRWLSTLSRSVMAATVISSRGAPPSMVMRTNVLIAIQKTMSTASLATFASALPRVRSRRA